MHNNNEDLSFYIFFKYDSERDSLAVFFHIFAELVESFHKIDNNLLTLFEVEIKPSFVWSN